MEAVHWFETEAGFIHVLKGEGFTYLMMACGSENYPAMLRLLQKGADVNAVSKFGETALLQAARYAHKDREAAPKIVRLLLERGADINAQTTPSGETALMRATYYGYIEIVRILLDNGTDVNLCGTDGNTVLSSIETTPSAAKRRKRIIKLLEEAGAVRCLRRPPSSVPWTGPTRSE